jgi:hypothetical protein
MDFDAAVAQLRAWCGSVVVVVLEPDHSVMSGRLHEVDSAGVDGAMFAVAEGARPLTGVAAALFRDAFASARLEDGALRVRQGRVELIIRPRGETAAPPPGR